VPGILKLFAWDVDAKGNVTRKGVASAGAISQIAISSLDSNRIVTAVRDGKGNLKVIVWDVDAKGGSSTHRRR
jgi:hypothetical protein